MVIYTWTEEDGYKEALAGLNENTGPFLKIRVVYCGIRGFVPLLRDVSTGFLLGVGTTYHLEGDAKQAAINLAKEVVKANLNETFFACSSKPNPAVHIPLVL
jgi:hypothetical protein